MNNVRTCLGCRQRAPKSSLLRFVERADEVVADHSATLPGRGAWVHPTVECVETALSRKAFGRALRSPKIAADWAALRLELSNYSIGITDPPENRLNGPVNN